MLGTTIATPLARSSSRIGSSIEGRDWPSGPPWMTSNAGTRAVVGDGEHATVREPAGRDVLHLALVRGDLYDLARFVLDREQVLVRVLRNAHHGEPAAVWRPGAGYMPRRSGHGQALGLAPGIDDGDVDVSGLPSIGADRDALSVRRRRP